MSAILPVLVHDTVHGAQHAQTTSSYLFLSRGTIEEFANYLRLYILGLKNIPSHGQSLNTISMELGILQWHANLKITEKLGFIRVFKLSFAKWGKKAPFF